MNVPTAVRSVKPPLTITGSSVRGEDNGGTGDGDTGGESTTRARGEPHKMLAVGAANENERSPPRKVMVMPRQTNGLIQSQLHQR